MSAPHSQRPLAKLDQIREMGAVIIAGARVVCRARTGERMEWARMAGSEYYERVDADAPVAPEGSVMHADPRESPPLELRGQR